MWRRKEKGEQGWPPVRQKELALPERVRSPVPALAPRGFSHMLSRDECIYATVAEAALLMEGDNGG